MSRRGDEGAEHLEELLGRGQTDDASELGRFVAALQRDARAAGHLDEARRDELVTRCLARIGQERLHAPRAALRVESTPSWSEDLRLVGAFVRERVRSSGLWRLLAASLLLHAVAVPAVAVLLIRQHVETGFQVRVLPVEEAVPVEEPEESLDPEAELLADRLPSADPEQPGVELHPWVIANALRRARFRLHGVHLSVPEGVEVGDEQDLETLLLRARSRGAEEGTWSADLDDAGAWARATPGERHLWTLVLLDRFALTGQRAALLEPALGHLRSSTESSLGQLLHQRAQAFGLLRPRTQFDPDAVAGVLGTRELEALRAELSPAAASWLADWPR